MIELLDPQDDDRRPQHSSFKLEISLAIGYQRRRAAVSGPEGLLVTLGLLVGSIAVVLLFLWAISQWRV